MSDGIKLSLLGAGVVAIVVGAMYLDVQNQKAWDAFSSTHQCKLIAHEEGYTAYGYHNGKYGSYWVPSRDTYHCNDGVNYTR